VSGPRQNSGVCPISDDRPKFVRALTRLTKGMSHRDLPNPNTARIQISAARDSKRPAIGSTHDAGAATRPLYNQVVGFFRRIAMKRLLALLAGFSLLMTQSAFGGQARELKVTVLSTMLADSGNWRVGLLGARGRGRQEGPV
jgi:hypothetical protein